MWPVGIIEFLGVLLYGHRFVISIPEEKITKALHQISAVVYHKKATIKTLQQLTGTLNFLNRPVVPGRVFTRQIYAKFTLKVVTKQGKILKPHHHVRIDTELQTDCKVWEIILLNQSVVNRPFIDFSKTSFEADQLQFFTDASRNSELGLDVTSTNIGLLLSGSQNTLRNSNPAIAYLELLALCIGIFTWQDSADLRNRRIVVFCDTQSIVEMVNQMTLGCQNCMVLLRKLAINNLEHNRRIFVKYVRSKENYLSDSLSHLKFNLFFQLAPQGTLSQPDQLPAELWPASKLWIAEN